MDILLSFVNQEFTPELKLGILNENFQFSWVQGEIKDIARGMTGLCYHNNKVYCAFQNDGIGVLDEGLNLIQHYKSPNIKDPHSLNICNNTIYIISTGSNSIYKMEIDNNGLITNEQMHWNVPEIETDYDYVHLNSLSITENGQFATYFGKRNKGQNWNEVENGKLVDILSGKTILDNLNQPHSLLLNGSKTLLFCESNTGLVKNHKGIIKGKFNGYIRGLAKTENLYLLAENARRKISKSRIGQIAGRINTFEDPVISDSKLYLIKPRSFTVSNVISLSEFGNEVYDILPLPGKFVDYSSKSIVPQQNLKKAILVENALVDFIQKGEKVLSEKDKVIEKLQSDIRLKNDENIKSFKLIEEKEKFIKVNQTEIEGLKKGVSNKDEALKNREKLIKSLRKQIETDRYTIEDLLSENVENSRVIASLYKKNGDNSIEIKNAELKVHLDYKTSECTSLQSQVDSLNIALMHEKDHKLELRKKIKELTDSIDQKTESNSKLKNDIVILTAKLKQLEITNQSMEQTNKELNETIEAKESKLINISNELDHVSGIGSELELQNDELKKSNAILKKKERDYKKKFKDIKKLRKKELKKFERISQKSSVKLQSLIEKNEEANQLIEKQKDIIDELDEKISKNVYYLEKYKSKIKSLYKDLKKKNKVEAKNSFLKKKNSLIKKSLSEHELTIKKLSNESDEFQAKLEVSKKSNEKITNSFETEKNKLNYILKKQAKELIDKNHIIENLSLKVEKKNEKLELRNSSLDALKDENEKLRNELSRTLNVMEKDKTYLTKVNIDQKKKIEYLDELVKNIEFQREKQIQELKASLSWRLGYKLTRIPALLISKKD